MVVVVVVVVDGGGGGGGGGVTGSGSGGGFGVRRERGGVKRNGRVPWTARYTGGHLGGVREKKRETDGARRITRLSFLPPFSSRLPALAFSLSPFRMLFFPGTLSPCRSTRTNVFTRAQSVCSHSLRVCHGRTVVAAAVVPDLYADPTC